MILKWNQISKDIRKTSIANHHLNGYDAEDHSCAEDPGCDDQLLVENGHHLEKLENVFYESK